MLDNCPCVSVHIASREALTSMEKQCGGVSEQHRAATSMSTPLASNRIALRHRTEASREREALRYVLCIQIDGRIPSTHANTFTIATFRPGLSYTSRFTSNAMLFLTSNQYQRRQHATIPLSLRLRSWLPSAWASDGPSSPS